MRQDMESKYPTKVQNFSMEIVAQHSTSDAKLREEVS